MDPRPVVVGSSSPYLVDSVSVRMGSVSKGKGFVIAVRPLVLAAGLTCTLLGPAADGQAQSVCTTVSGATFCTNGTTARRVGKTIYDDSGRSWTEVGESLYGSDGTTYKRLGPSVYDDRGQAWSRVGNSVRGTDGASCTRIGRTTHCR